MKIHEPYILYESNNHKFIWLGLDESETEKGILTNQYLIVHGNQGILLDPGGYFVFERVFENASRFVKPENIKAILYSHQDPDVIGGLTLWLDTAPNAKIYVSHLWERFIPHLGVDLRDRIIDLPDEGMDIDFGSFKIKAIPAHFMHSPGNFHYYDPIAKIYFSGDMGAAVFKDKWYLIVDNFEEHVKLMEWFHRRYIASRRAIELWAKRIEGLDIDIVAPQHGSIFMGENAKKFLNWLKNLDKVGVNFISS
ncbi:MBL fold metallo-hydrolase [Sulfolobus sp. SCGC AB-777_G06]|nr:MBL fold metallo-hydrolase [Sulfolobus sp. SCGC AB-777_G06]